MTYATDHLGRQTYLSAQCLYSTKRDFVERCVDEEAVHHRADIAFHAQQVEEAQAEAQEAERERLAASQAAEERRKQEIANAQAAAENARAERDPRTHAARIHAFKMQIAGAEAAIARERRIGQISGYVNKEHLYLAGMMIDGMRQNVAREYRTYVSLGGRKPLSAL